MGTLRRRVLGIALLLCAPCAAADEALWALLQGGGQVVLIRHAQTTPGVGDPPGMRLDDCRTQRNLDERGRAEAARLGSAFKAKQVAIEELLSSPWCRCVETARIAFGRAPRVHAALGNLFGRPERAQPQVAQLKQLAARKPGRGNVVMLTHGSTIQALTGISPATAEMVVLTPQPDGELRLAGRLPVQ